MNLRTYRRVWNSFNRNMNLAKAIRPEDAGVKKLVEVASHYLGSAFMESRNWYLKWSETEEGKAALAKERNAEMNRILGAKVTRILSRRRRSHKSQKSHSSHPERAS